MPTARCVVSLAGFALDETVHNARWVVGGATVTGFVTIDGGSEPGTLQVMAHLAAWGLNASCSASTMSLFSFHLRGGLDHCARPDARVVKIPRMRRSSMNAVTALVVVLSSAVCVLPAWGFAPGGPGGAEAMTPVPDSGLGTNLSPSLGSPPDVGSPPNLGAPPDLGSPVDVGSPPGLGSAPDMGSPPNLGSPPDVGTQSMEPASSFGSEMGARSGSEMGADSRPSSTPSGLASPATPGSPGAASGP
jgi:hypothetical protein